MVLEFVLPICATIAAGLTWTGFGYLKAWRRHKDDPDWEGFNVKKLRNDVILGVVLGIGTIIANAVQGVSAPVIDSFGAFVVAVTSMFGTIAAVDSFIVGGVFGLDETARNE